MRYLFIILALLAMPAFAERPQIEVGIGITHATHQDNMTWWQEEFPHSLRMNSPSLSLGIKMPLATNVLGFERVNGRIGYEYFGKFRSTAVATASDQDYGACRYETSKCWPLSNWYGVGTVQGLYATVQPEIDMGKYSIFFEGGLSAYWSTWKVDIPDWRPTREGPVQSLTATHKAKWQYTYIMGLGIRKGPLSLVYTLRRAEATGDLFPAIYHDIAHNLSLRYSF